jgi:hypothetical protein
MHSCFSKGVWSILIVWAWIFISLIPFIGGILGLLIYTWMMNITGKVPMKIWFVSALPVIGPIMAYSWAQYGPCKGASAEDFNGGNDSDDGDYGNNDYDDNDNGDDDDNGDDNKSRWF